MTGAYPNPVYYGDAPVKFDVYVPASSVVKWSVFTAGFRKIDWGTRTVPEGKTTLAWGMKDWSGEATANGLYYIRVEVMGVQMTRKILKVMVLK